MIPGQEAKILDAAGQIRPCTANIESLCCSEDPVQPKKEERKKKTYGTFSSDPAWVFPTATAYFVVTYESFSGVILKTLSRHQNN